MKRFILFTFLICFTLPVLGQEKWREVDLKVNGIGSGTTYSTIIKKLRKPLHSENGGFDECGGGFIKTLHYSGLNIGLLSDAKGKVFSVISIEITSSKWLIEPGINVGANIEYVQAKLGQPIGDDIDSQNTLDYVTKDNLGIVNFYFRNNRLVKVEMQETLCKDNIRRFYISV